MAFIEVMEYIQGHEAKNSYGFVLPCTGLSPTALSVQDTLSLPSTRMLPGHLLLLDLTVTSMGNPPPVSPAPCTGQDA